MNWLVRRWYSSPHFLSYLFTPFSGLYRLSVALRHWLYKHQYYAVHKFQVPIIVAGNITLGGTGKTPFVIWLAKFLQQHDYRPGIVSRGYGGMAENYPYTVTAESDPAIASDEAVLIVQQTRCPMVVAPNRPAAVKHLLETNNCNIVISDDGLQHYALARDMEIILVDGDRRFGNGFCLPAGPLREPIKRLQQVDFIIINGKPQDHELVMNLIPGDIYNIQQRNASAGSVLAACQAG